MNLKTLAVGLGIATAVSGGMVAQNVQRTADTKAPVTNVVDNKGLDNDKLEITSVEDVQLQEQVISSLIDALKTLSEQDEEIASILNEIISQLPEAEQKSVLQNGFDKVVKKVGLDKVQDFLEDSSTATKAIFALICMSIGFTSFFASAKATGEKVKIAYAMKDNEKLMKYFDKFKKQVNLTDADIIEMENMSEKDLYIKFHKQLLKKAKFWEHRDYTTRDPRVVDIMLS